MLFMQPFLSKIINHVRTKQVKFISKVKEGYMYESIRWPPSERAYHRLEQTFMQHPVTAQRFYLDVGMLERDEMGFGSPDGGPNALESNRMMRDKLRSLGYEVQYGEYPGGHDLLWGAAPVADALKILIGKKDREQGMLK
jgi:enterochelin esterase family protein